VTGGGRRGHNGRVTGARPTIVLASGSPRRRELLEQVGFDVLVDPSHVPEDHDGGHPDRVVLDLAHAKASEVAARHDGLPVLAADTMVVLDGDLLGKPADRGDAVRMLRLLSGRWHDVFTGVVLVPPEGRALERVGHTRVRLADLRDAEIARYVDGPEPYDKAGAYGIQATAGWFVAEVAGSPSNVMGLPLEVVRDLVAEAGLPIPELGAPG